MARAEQGSRAISARFGKHLTRSFGVLILAGPRWRRRLGLSSADQLLIEQVLSYRTDADEWPAVDQRALARGLGVSRPTVAAPLQRLRKSGLIATRPHPRYGTRTKTLRYCLDPYLALLAMSEGNAGINRDLWAEGNERLLRFTEQVDWERWVWEVDGLHTPFLPVGEVLRAFLRRYGLSHRFAPPSIGVSAVDFLSEELALSVPPTQEDSHLITSTSVQAAEALTPKELRTLVQEQPRTSELKTVDNQLATLVDEQPEDLADDHRHGDPVVEEALDWISKQ